MEGIEMFKKAILTVMLFLFLFANVGYTQSTYQTGEEKSLYPNSRQFFASAYAGFFHDGVPFGIQVNKDCVVRPYLPNYYTYDIMIVQAREWEYTPINIKQIIISNGKGFVIIKVPYNHKRAIKDTGIIDTVYYNNVGELNRLILNAQGTMLIRIVTDQNRNYDFYSDDEFLYNLRRVANWS